MTGTTCRVYDLAYPSPVTLKEISAIAVVTELRREKIARAEIKTENVLDVAKEIPLKQMIPDVPSMIYDLLEEYIAKFKVSKTDYWTPYARSFNFDAFVFDWNGTIHDVRTAKRMMLCGRLTVDERFEIACKYCLEDDIRRIWPFVSSNMNLIRFDFRERPLIYYWICCLKNELHNVVKLGIANQTIDEVMFYNCLSCHERYACLEYFWNRIPYERRSRATIRMSVFDSGLFTRFILPKLDDFQLESFLAKTGAHFMIRMLTHFYKGHRQILPTWMYIRNKMNESQFIRMIKKLLAEENIVFTRKERLNSNDGVYLFCEVWKNSPENLKRCAINDVLLDAKLFRRVCTRPYRPREMRFLITVLSDASFEQRHKFLLENWHNLIPCALAEDFLVIVKLCFRDENDISLFKQQYMSKWENINPCCVQLLEDGCFKELSELLSFCYSDRQKVTEVKQQLLRSNFLGENSILRYNNISYYDIEELNAFIEDAFEDVDLRAEFKNQFVLSPTTQNCLCDSIRHGNFYLLIQLVETFVPEERTRIGGGCMKCPPDRLDDFLNWYFNNNAEKIRTIKEQYSDRSEVFDH